MDARDKALFYFARQLGHLTDREIRTIYKNKISLDAYLQEHLTAAQQIFLRLIFIKQCLLRVAKYQGLLSEERYQTLAKIDISQEKQITRSWTALFEEIPHASLKKIAKELTAEGFLNDEEYELFVSLLAPLTEHSEFSQPVQEFPVEMLSSDLSDEVCDQTIAYIDASEEAAFDAYAQTTFHGLPISEEDEKKPETKTDIITPDSELGRKITGVFKRQKPVLVDMPTKVSDYQIIDLLGQGGMGEVFLARPPGADGPLVVIKLLSEELCSSQTIRQRFIQEAQVHSCLDHPNIVKMHEFGYCYDLKRDYIAMEYIKGESLSQILKRQGKLSEKNSIKIALTVAKALEHAYLNGIIHRDVKPANIMIDKTTGKVKLADFGLGKMLTQEGNTRSGEMMGSPYYMAPEQITDSKTVDHRGDIYALGATLYHMISGFPPYAEYKVLHDLLKAKQRTSPRPLQEIAPQVSVYMAQIVEKAIALRKEKRYQTYANLCREMKAVYARYKK